MKLLRSIVPRAAPVARANPGTFEASGRPSPDVSLFLQ